MSGIDEVDGVVSKQDRKSLEGELDLCGFRIIGVMSNNEDLV